MDAPVGASPVPDASATSPNFALTSLMPVGQSPAGQVLSGLHGAAIMLHPMLLPALEV